jgi:hypothetical protein
MAHLVSVPLEHSSDIRPTVDPDPRTQKTQRNGWVWKVPESSKTAGGCQGFPDQDPARIALGRRRRALDRLWRRVAVNFMNVNLPQAARQDKSVERPMAHDIFQVRIENGKVGTVTWHLN